MKLSKLKLKNFAKFENFEMVFNDDITHLVGMNGDGKTTVGLTALWAGFKGIAEKSKTGALIGQRFRFITEGKKSLDVEITLHDDVKDMDVVLTRHITKSTNTIKIDSSSLYPELTKEYMENLFNVAFLSASHFSALTGKEQAAAMGIDTTGYDENLRIKKEDAAGFRRDLKRIGELTPVEECEQVDIEEVLARRKVAVNHNAIQSDRRQCIKTYKETITEYQAKIEDFKKNIETNKILLAETETALEDSIDLEAIENEITSIAETNQDAAAYDTYTTSLAEQEEAQGYLEKNLAIQKDIQAERAKYLQSKAFGIKGLCIDEAGNLTKDGKLIRQPYFSKGELEVLVARIAMNLNPELKVRFIDDFEMLDDNNQELLLKNLTKKGFQIITATVGNKKKDDKTVLLRECKVIESSNNVAEQDTGVGDWDEEEAADNETETIKAEEACIDVPAPEASNTTGYDDDDDDDF